MLQNKIKKSPFKIEQEMGETNKLSDSIISNEIIESQRNSINEDQTTSSSSSSNFEEKSPTVALLYCNALRGLFNCSNSMERIESKENGYLINTVNTDRYVIQLRLPESLGMNVNYLHFIFLRGLWYKYKTNATSVTHKDLYEAIPHIEAKRQLNKANHLFINETMRGLQNIQFRVFSKDDINFPEILGKKIQPDGWYSLNITNTKVTVKAGKSQPGYIIGCPEVLERILEIIGGKFNYFYLNSDLLKMSFYNNTKKKYTAKRWIAINICIYDTLINRISFLKKDKVYSVNYIKLEKLYQVLESVLAIQINPSKNRERIREIKETISGYLEAFKQKGFISGYSFLKDTVKVWL